MRPAPQGRGYRVRKRSNHVTLMVDNTPTAKELKKTAAKKTYSSKDTKSQNVTTNNQ
jgi:large subunit ribosomal protein L22